MTAPPIDLSSEQWQIVHAILRRELPGIAVWAFGSRARRTARRYSDLDLAVIADPSIGLSALAKLKDEFSESDLPWKVDVVDWATLSEEFRQIIQRDKVIVQESTGGPERS